MKPIKYRRLTKAEASRLGVSYSAKRQVRADIKRVTASTKLYTNREAAQAKLGKTKEKYTAYRISKPNKVGAVTYRNVKQTEHFKLAKIAGLRHVQIAVYGEREKKPRFGGSQLENLDGGSEGAVTISYGFDGDELRQRLDSLYSTHGYLGFNAKHPPVKVNVIIYRDKEAF